jgi:hypothetical protein
MVQVSTPEVNSLASTIKTLPVCGVFSLDGEWQATLLFHRRFPYIRLCQINAVLYYKQTANIAQHTLMFMKLVQFDTHRFLIVGIPHILSWQVCPSFGLAALRFHTDMAAFNIAASLRSTAIASCLFCKQAVPCFQTFHHRAKQWFYLIDCLFQSTTRPVNDKAKFRRRRRR